MNKKEKTNVTRLLETARLSFECRSYDPEITDGELVAKAVGEESHKTYKTLVTVGNSKKNYVFVIPVNRELDLKACAVAAGEKSIEMIPQKDLLPLTGYVHGGCSPVGMKKKFPTFFDKAIEEIDMVTLSAGKRGCQITISPQDLILYTQGKTAPLSREKTKA